jgi:hypothetical protein
MFDFSYRETRRRTRKEGSGLEVLSLRHSTVQHFGVLILYIVGKVCWAAFCSSWTGRGFYDGVERAWVGHCHGMDV